MFALGRWQCVKRLDFVLFSYASFTLCVRFAIDCVIPTMYRMCAELDREEASAQQMAFPCGFPFGLGPRGISTPCICSFKLNAAVSAAVAVASSRHRLSALGPSGNRASSTALVVTSSDTCLESLHAAPSGKRFVGRWQPPVRPLRRGQGAAPRHQQRMVGQVCLLHSLETR